MYTNQMRITGLSGLDTDSMVKQLMQAESMKLTALKRTRELSVYKQDAYRGVMDSMLGLQTNFMNYAANTANNMRSAANYRQIVNSVKSMEGGKLVDSTGIGVRSISGSAGKVSMTVQQIAAKDRFVGNAVEDGVRVNGAEDHTINLDGYSKGLDLSGVDFTSDTTAQTEINNLLAAKFGRDGLDNKVSARVDNGEVIFSAAKGHTLSVDGKSSSSQYLKKTLAEAFGTTGEVSFKINNQEFKFDSDTTTVASMLERINSDTAAGARISFNSLNHSFSIESTKEGAVNKLDIDDASGFFTNKVMGVAAGNPAGLESVRESTAQDARFIYNGTQASRETNQFTIGDLEFTLSAASLESGGAPKTFEIESKVDYSKTSDTIMKFVAEYNTMIEYLQNQLNTARPKSDSYNYYQPLSDDERKALTETDAASWDVKAKSGMLYRDATLNTLVRDLRSMMYEKVDLGNGKKLALYDIGITTSNVWREGAKLKIDEKKLKEAVSKYGEDVISLFTKASDVSALNTAKKAERRATEGIAERINDAINAYAGPSGKFTDKAGRTNSDLNSDLFKQISKHDEAINKMLVTLRTKEEAYFAKFARLEAVMTKANAQLSQIQNYFGMS